MMHHLVTWLGHQNFGNRFFGGENQHYEFENIFGFKLDGQDKKAPIGR